MRLRVYSVLDKAVSAYLPVLMFRSEGEAIRAFADSVATEGSHFAKHRGDFALCFLGWFDDHLGQFDCSASVVVAEAATVVESYGGA